MIDWRVNTVWRHDYVTADVIRVSANEWRLQPTQSFIAE